MQSNVMFYVIAYIQNNSSCSMYLQFLQSFWLSCTKYIPYLYMFESQTYTIVAYIYYINNVFPSFSKKT